MNKSFLTSIVIVGTFFGCAVVSPFTSAQPFMPTERYMVICNGAANGDWAITVDNLYDALDNAGGCINEGGVPTVRPIR